MPRIAPFRGLVYAPSAGPLDRLTAPPYDVISEDRRLRYLARHPDNIVHIDLAANAADTVDDPYGAAAHLLASQRRRGVLVEAGPGYFAYEMRYALPTRTDSVRGVFCAMELEPWGGSVLPHEEVMAGPLQDRLALLRATRTHISAIYGTIAGPNANLAALLDETVRSRPSFALTDREGVEHRMWHLPPDPAIARWIDREALLIADGHHRYTTALAYRDERHATDGPGPWDRILTLVVDAGSQEVPVLPYHRVQLAGDALPAQAKAGSLADILARVDDEGLAVGTIARSSDGGLRYGISSIDGHPPSVRALHEAFLDPRVAHDALRFTHDAADAEQLVAGGDAVAAYILPPTTPARIRAVIELGERLPRKSTFFWPKPRTGMVLMPLDQDPALGSSSPSPA